MQNKKIKKLLIGTNNKGKLKEIRDLLPKSLKTCSTYQFKLKSPEENGKTFRENSMLKSRYFSKRTNLICLADDSGLEIDVLKKNLEFILLVGVVKTLILIWQLKKFSRSLIKLMKTGNKKK